MNDNPNNDNLKRLETLIRKTRIIIQENLIYCDSLREQIEQKDQLQQVLTVSLECSEYLDVNEINFETIRELLDGHYYRLLNIINELFASIILYSETDYFSLDRWREKNKLTFFFGNYILLNQNYRVLKELISKHFIDSYKASYELVVDENSPLWDTVDMEYMEINSDLSYVRNISKSIISHAKSIADHFSLTILEEQISEIIKNAIGHGNQNNIGKRVKLWYAFSNKIFKIIVEDEGEGFKNLEQWNDFNRKRNEALKAGNMEEMLKYMQYRGPDSTDMDGGNSLFAALEYWDNGLVYNNKKNKVVAVKYLY